MECWGVDLIGMVTGYNEDEGERMRTPSYRGKQYILIIVDHYSRYVFVRPLRDKSEATQELIHIIKLQQNYTKKKLARIHSDNGGEFINKALEEFLKENGTEITTTVKETSEHNSITERMNKSLEEIARALMIQSNSPEELWCEAMELAAIIWNNTCQSSIHDQIPAVLHSGKRRLQFDIRKLATFGCNAYVVKPMSKRGKFQSRTLEGIYLGYDLRHNAHRILMIKTMKVVIERSVRFDEDNFDHLDISKGNIEVLMNEALSEASTKDNKEFEVKRIEMQVNILGIPWYVVYWKGYRAPTLESIDSMREQVPEMVKEYEIRHQTLMTLAAKKRPDLVSEINKRKGKKVKFTNATTKDDAVSVAEYKIPLSIEEALYHHPDKLKWKQSIEAELGSILKMKVGTLTLLPEGKKAIGSKWVFAVKRNKDNEIIRWKSRLVVQGFSQTYGVDYFDTYAPTVRYKSVKWLLALAAQHDYEIKQIDYDTAFLNAELKEEVYMKLPPGYRPKGTTKHHVWRLIRALYGLKQAPREWWLKLSKTLNSLGYYASEIDESVYMKKVGEHRIYLTLYVDDTLSIYPKAVEDVWLQDKASIASVYPIKDLSDCEWILNMSVDRDRINRTITLSQGGYVDLIIGNHDIEPCRPVSTPYVPYDLTLMDPNLDGNRPLNTKEHHEYRMIVGELLYAACITRIDLAYITNLLARFNNKPYLFHLEGVRRVLKYLQHHIHDIKLVFKHDPKQDKEYNITIYSDSNWAGESGDRMSTGGWISSFNGTPIAWQSIKQKTVALSSTEAEYYALGDAAREALYLRQWFIHYTGKTPNITILGDNDGSILQADHSTNHNRTKHIDIKHHFIRQCIRDKLFKLEWICTKNQLADILTKPLARIRYEYLINKLMGKVEGPNDKFISDNTSFYRCN
jgi:hypothetical protein